MNLVILSRSSALYSTQSLFLAAKRRGHTVRIIDYTRCDLILEGNQPLILYENQYLERVSAIVPRIGASATDSGVAIIRQFEMMNVFSVLSPDALIKTRDKYLCLQYLSQNSIPVPKTALINDFNNFSEMLDKFEKFPVVIKLKSSTHGLGVILAENKSTAMSIIETLYRLKQTILVQEFIEESEGSDIRIFVVDNDIVATMERKARPGEFRSNLHRGATPSRVRISDLEAKLAKRATNLLGLKVAGVDILRSKRGPLILEVNASPGLEGIEGTSGVDIAGKIIQYTERELRAKWKYSRNY